MLIHGSKFSAAARNVISLAAAVIAMTFGATSAHAYTTASGWVASDYVTGFSHGDEAGPVGVVFDASGNLLVANSPEGSLYKIAPGGGDASKSKIRDGYGQAEGLAWDKDGRLYLARGNQHDVVEINPSSGEIIRTVVGNLPCPVGLATDPISGDLFVSNVFCKGGGIMRITGFHNGPGTARNYAGTQDADGLTFAPDGTLYAAGGTKVVRITGTNTKNPGGVSDVANVPTIDGITYAPANAGGDEYLIVARNDGEIDRVDFNGTVTPLLTGGSRGDLVTVGPDRCMYITLQDRIIKFGPSDGSCAFAPPVQPGVNENGVLGEKAAQRVVDTAIKATAPKSTR
jgi:sugar lactone lactonase YvrE